MPRLPPASIRSHDERSQRPPRIYRAIQRLDPDRIAQLIADHEAGQSTTAPMSMYGIGKGMVLRLLHDASGRLRSHGQRNILGDAYDCDPEPVRAALRAAGVRLRPQTAGWESWDESARALSNVPTVVIHDRLVVALALKPLEVALDVATHDTRPGNDLEVAH